MEMSTWLLFVVTAFITALTPGPGVVMVVSSAVGVGVRAAVFCSLGNEAGLFMVSSATIIGLGAVLKSSALLFVMLKILGSAYLIYLGIRQWKAQAGTLTASNAVLTDQSRGDGKDVVQGLIVATTNPKAILFFTALFPQFIEPNQPVFSQFCVITATFVLATMVSHVIYVSLAYRAKGWLAAPHRIQVFNRITGSAYILLGLAMLRFRHQSSLS